MDVDFVITWVDGNDPKWRKEKLMYEGANAVDKSEIRYRDMELLKYWFRSVELNAPWVRKIFFVTCGQKPEWLNDKHEKLEIVDHKDFIPKEYLPTFSSHPIELSIHRISGLSEKFVYFNDDMFIIDKVEESDFFYKGLPCDYGVLSPIMPKEDIENIVVNDMKVINNTFSIKKSIGSHFYKWFSINYGKDLLRNIIFSIWPVFLGFRTQHLPNAYLKSTFVEVWSKNFNILDDTCKRKFRDIRDVNHWLMQYWQIINGNFYPRKKQGVYLLIDQVDEIRKVMDGEKKILCINDRNVPSFSHCKTVLNDIFQRKFPKKCSFEK